MKSALETEFHEEMVSIYYKAGLEVGYWANKFLHMVREDGGIGTARRLLKPQKGLSPSLQLLAREKRVDLSMEALVLKNPWKKLFTEEEIGEARKRIEAV
jgi:hypothetical protein